MKKVIIASNNRHKIAEIRAALDFKGWEFLSPSELGVVSEPEETATSFEGNAHIKAAAIYKTTGYAALADDSGLVVDYLGGAPGVYSSRYAGRDGDDDANNARLLRELEGVPNAERTARFVCSLVFIDIDGSEQSVCGTIEGRIGYALQGDGGFGYDPLFFPDEFAGEKTLAELSQEEKNAISHRGNALRALKEKLGK